jgi:murein DD-endopeptidase MepM/ murein hydrolase activator NlpD
MKRSPLERLGRPWIALGLAAISLLASCSAPEPQSGATQSPGPAAFDQSSAPGVGALPATNTPAATPSIAPTNQIAQLASPTAGSTALPETATPLPALIGSGLRPDQALLLRPPELGPDPPVDWRPPPVAVPHALHPDDHYWLARPIPSDRRNYDLEWYPYGNQPLRPEALPYRVHHGVDFPNDPGTQVFAAGSGTVIWAGPLASRLDGISYYGNTVVIVHDWQWLEESVYTLYAHTLELFVGVGDHVEEGQLLAGVGASGDVSGPHLHLEVRVGSNNYRSTRNPALWLAPYEGWGTLAGRFVDVDGDLIHGALITLLPIRVDVQIDLPRRQQRTYAPSGVQSDEVWGENFAFGDLPAGKYTVLVTADGATFRRDVEILPGQTNFIVVQADFEFNPTATPQIVPSQTPTITVTADTTLTPTVTLTATIESGAE